MTAQPPTYASLGADAREAFDAVFRAVQSAEHVPGLVAGVVRDGRLAHLLALGTADLETEAPVMVATAFRIASMSKQFAALGVLLLRDEGRLALEAPVADYLPQVAALTPPTEDSRPITVRDLLNHTAGFVTDDPWADRNLGIAPEALDALLAGGGLYARAPQTAFEYSNLGYALLGRVLTAVSGRSWRDLLRERVFQPLGMADTTFDAHAVPRGRCAVGYRWSGGVWSPEPPEPDGELGVMGGLVTTAPDYARWLAFLLDAWPARDGPQTGPVPRATLRELALTHAPPARAEVRVVDGEPIAVSGAYGYGFISTVDSRLGRYVQHAGGLPGWGSNGLFSPEAGVGVFAFGNRTYAPMARATWDAALALQRAGEWTPRPIPLDPRLARAAEAVRRAYGSGRMAGAERFLADNLLPDEPAPRRDAELAALKARYGAAASWRVEPRHALAGCLVLVCARGELGAEIALAPGPEGRLQLLRFTPDAQA